MIQLWYGTANQWDCDEMGHMNVRIYAEKALEGLGTLAHEIEMGHAFRLNAPSTLIPVDQHIRFINEVHPGRPLSMAGCVLDVGENDALIYQELVHGDGRVAAAFRTRVVHAEAKSGKPFQWSKRSRNALESLVDTPPLNTRPRSIDIEASFRDLSETTKAFADTLKVPVIGMGIVPEDHCDPNKRMKSPWIIGRISDSAPNLLYDWRNTVAEASGVRMGAAVLEYRLIYRRWPTCGDRFEIRSSLNRVEEKVHSIVHWVLDPTTGFAWSTAEAIAVTFDLDKRKIVPTPLEQMKALETLAPKGLTL